MDEREQRGLWIAATAKIEQKHGVWFVPSETGKGKYTVRLGPEKPHCTCKDHFLEGHKCKHIFAVEFAKRRDENPDDPASRLDSIEWTDRPKQKTYRQDWTAYNLAQTHEKEQFLRLLHDLCSRIKDPPQSMGRPRLPLGDAVFAVCFKVYSTVSGRRFMSDLRYAESKGFISKTPHFNSIFNYLENSELTPILQRLIIDSSLPLKAVDVDFACDSSGFTSTRFVRWFDHKFGVVKQHHTWVKAHVMCGVKTNVVTAVEIRKKQTNDSTLLPALVLTTAENFAVKEVSGDKAYATLQNYAVIEGVGSTPFIAFKSNHSATPGGLWGKMFHYFSFNRDDFLAHYHKRSNAESTFSMIKAKFRDHVRSKTDVSMKNEVLCKILCHNICCVIHEMFELGIDPSFGADNCELEKAH